MKKIILLSFLFVFNTVSSQKITSGIVTYKVHIALIPPNVSGDSMYDERLREFSKKTFLDNKPAIAELTFTEFESLYVVNGRGLTDKMSVSWSVAGRANAYYVNRQTRIKKYQEVSVISEMIYLVTYKNPTWKITKETKKIKGYTCFKALEVDAKKKKELLKTAWFTKEIPFAYGPKEIGGLPGLILELSYGHKSFVAEKIVKNPKGITIVAPTKGMEITHEALMEKHRNFFKS